MSDPSEMPWSNNPYAPQIPYPLYFAEKANFTGAFLGTIFYGIVTVMFFQCMSALLSPDGHKRNAMTWGLVGHTTAMFLFATAYTATNLGMLSISFVDNREFSAVDGVPPGPVGYQLFITPGALNIVASLMIFLNNCLADGLLLYRCYIIYAQGYLVITFPSLAYLVLPCLMYTTSVGMGIWFMYQTSHPSSVSDATGASIGVPYLSVSVSLNILLTLLMVVRLILHSRSTKNVVGGGGLYNAVVTMLIESSALSAVVSVLFIGPWGARSWVADIFLPTLVQVQVIAQFFIILQVASRRALANNTTTSGDIGSIRFGSQTRPANDGGTAFSGDPPHLMEVNGVTLNKPGVGAETAIEPSSWSVLDAQLCGVGANPTP